MKLPYVIFWLALSVYSLILLGVEWQTSHAYVRQYFTDIEGDVMFFAVNTTLSVSLLASTALLLLFAAFADRSRIDPKAQPYLIGQGLMFGLLAFDDRFQLHERLGYRIDLPDHFIMAVWCLIEIMIIICLLKPRHISLSMASLFIAGSGFFAIMMFFDALMPRHMIMRLSIEDLAKTWAAAMYFAFAWQAARFHLFAVGRPLTDMPVPFWGKTHQAGGSGSDMNQVRAFKNSVSGTEYFVSPSGKTPGVR